MIATGTTNTPTMVNTRPMISVTKAGNSNGCANSPAKNDRMGERRTVSATISRRCGTKNRAPKPSDASATRVPNRPATSVAMRPGLKDDPGASRNRPATSRATSCEICRAVSLTLSRLTGTPLARARTSGGGPGRAERFTEGRAPVMAAIVSEAPGPSDPVGRLRSVKTSSGVVSGPALDRTDRQASSNGPPRTYDPTSWVFTETVPPVSEIVTADPSLRSTTSLAVRRESEALWPTASTADAAGACGSLGAAGAWLSAGAVPSRAAPSASRLTRDMRIHPVGGPGDQPEPNEAHRYRRGQYRRRPNQWRQPAGQGAGHQRGPDRRHGRRDPGKHRLPGGNRHRDQARGGRRRQGLKVGGHPCGEGRAGHGSRPPQRGRPHPATPPPD